MKKTTILYSLFFVVSNVNFSSAQASDKPPVKYDHNNFLKTSSHLRFELEVGNGGYQGRHVTVGAGGRFLAYHFYDKISAEFSYVHRYWGFVPSKTMMGFLQNESIAPFLGREMDFSLSYSVSHKTIEKNEYMNLQTGQKQSVIAQLPVKTKRFLDLKLGMIFFDLPGQIEFVSSQPNLYSIQKVQFMQKTKSISLGISLKGLKHDVYSVNNNRQAYQSLYSDFFVDFLYALNPSFPVQLFQPVYPGNEYGEPTAYNSVSSLVYEDIKSSLKYSPFGGQLGYRVGNMRHGLGFKILIGFRPGYMSQAKLGQLDNLSGSLTLAYHIPVFLKNK